VTIPVIPDYVSMNILLKAFSIGLISFSIASPAVACTVPVPSPNDPPPLMSKGNSEGVFGSYVWQGVASEGVKPIPIFSFLSISVSGITQVEDLQSIRVPIRKNKFPPGKKISISVIELDKPVSEGNAFKYTYPLDISKARTDNTHYYFELPLPRGFHLRYNRLTRFEIPALNTYWETSPPSGCNGLDIGTNYDVSQKPKFYKLPEKPQIHPLINCPPTPHYSASPGSPPIRNVDHRLIGK
jgi:hypothetical protein